MGPRFPKRRSSRPHPLTSGEPYFCLPAKAKEALPYLIPLPIPTADPTLEAGGWIFSGVRATAGSWLDAGEVFGVEGRGFLLERKSETLSAATTIASASISSSTRLWGAEANALFNL